MKIRNLLLIILASILCLALVACGSECAHNDANGDGKCDSCGETVGSAPSDECTTCADSDGDGKCDTCGKAVQTAAGGEFVKDGVPSFQFVISSKITSSDTRYQIQQLANTLNSLTSGGIKVTNDTDTNIMTNEIIIGTVTTRGDTYAIDGHDWGISGWAVKVIGSKVVVVAGSDDAMEDALAVLKKDVLGIKTTTKDIKNITVTESMSSEKAPGTYQVKNLSIDGNDVRNMSISYPDNSKFAQDAALNIQYMIYRYTGIYIDVYKASKVTGKTIAIEIIDHGSENSIDEGCHVFVRDGGLVFETEFPNTLTNITTEFFSTYIVNTVNTSVNFLDDFTKKYNVRDIYYSDFDAVGDGLADDFMAIKAAHDYANKYGHTVHANIGATYYFGKGSGTSTITIQTDTYWHGCKFVFNDSILDIDSEEANTSVFTIAPSVAKRLQYGVNVPITSVEKGATNIGWAPGYPVMVLIYNENVKHYIRYGTNANEGSAQCELVIIDAEGNVDPSTPIQWTYETITAMHLCHINDAPIVISGADNENYAEIETIFNGNLTVDKYYKRNIHINRSNVIIKNVKHTVTGEIPYSQGGTGTPYSGFITTVECNNVTVENFIFHKLEAYHLADDPVSQVGTYEIGATMSNNVTWKNCKQDKFFEDDGSIIFRGLMGTNFCRNLTFDHVEVHSFDAHQGVYNATIKNSTCEHLNFIGDGTIILENVTIYADPMKTAINLRSDYGSTWAGDIIIDGLDIKYTSATKNSDFFLINASWVNHYFGYTTYLPQNIVMKDVRMVEYSYTVKNAVRYETIVAVNEKQLLIYPAPINDRNPEIGQPVFTNGVENKNINVATKSITVINSDQKKPLNIKWPKSEHFKDTKVTVDGVEIAIGLG